MIWLLIGLAALFIVMLLTSIKQEKIVSIEVHKVVNCALANTCMYQVTIGSTVHGRFADIIEAAELASTLAEEFQSKGYRAYIVYKYENS